MRKIKSRFKNKQYSHKHYPAAFLKDRHGAVKARLDSLNSQLYNCRSKVLKRALLRQYNSLAYFDKPANRAALLKYARFLHITSGQKQDQHLSKLIAEFEIQCLNRGVVTTLKRFKAYYDVALRFAVGHSFEPIPYERCDKEGFPYKLKFLKPLLVGSRSERQTALGILQVIKLVRFYPENYSLGAIEKLPLNDTSAFQEGPVKIGNYFREAYQKVKDKVPSDFKITKFIGAYKRTLNWMFPNQNLNLRFNKIQGESGLHFSGRNGPNGPCLSTVVLDYRALTCDPLLLNHIQEMAQLTNNLELQVLLSAFEQEDSKVLSSKEKVPIHSKINLKEESWGRLRPFATVDYFTHSSLRGFHNYLYKQLGNYQEDCTKDQEKGSNAIRLWTANLVNTESADLSEATNAIPILVQREIVQQIAGDQFAYRWTNIISNRAFKGPTGEVVYYRTGQPMGASSSWPMLAMWHHVIVRTCMTYLGIRWGRDQEGNYYIIGDDIAMKRQQLFRIYETAVAILQDVGISKKKGFHKETDRQTNYLPGANDKSVAEFAKRVFCNGVEVTPVPPDEVTDFVRNPATIVSMTKSLERRDYLVDARVAHDLANLSFDRQLALDCLFSPFNLSAQLRGNSSIEMENLRAVTIWNERQSIETVSQIIFAKVREQVTKTLLDMGERLTNWAEACLLEEEIKVKSWTYQSRAMSKVFYMTMEAMQNVYDRTLEEFYDQEFEELPENWQHFKRSVGNLQVIFDIDKIFSGLNNPKVDKYRFIDNIIAKAIHSYRKEFRRSGP